MKNIILTKKNGGKKMNIKYKPHPIDGNINYIGVNDKNKIMFDGYLIGGKIWFVDCYSKKGKWDGKK